MIRQPALSALFWNPYVPGTNRDAMLLPRPRAFVFIPLRPALPPKLKRLIPRRIHGFLTPPLHQLGNLFQRPGVALLNLGQLRQLGRIAAA